MSRFELVKAAYERGSWDIEMVRNAVKKKWITKAQFKEITGEDYVA